MGASKGTVNNPNGRPVGSRNLRTQQWEALGNSIATNHTERFNRILNELDDQAFCEVFLKTLEYFKPKLQRTEMKNEDSQTLTVQVVRRVLTGSQDLRLLEPDKTLLPDSNQSNS